MAAAATRVVGRDSELSRLDGACASTWRGQGAAICLAGPPGIGKTVLLQTAIQQARQLDLTTANAWCWAEGAPPLWPWLELLAQLEILTDINDLAAQGIQAFRMVERAVAEAAMHSPLLIAIDDLQNADEATMLLTRYMAARISDSPVILLLARRPHDHPLLTEIDRACEVLTLPTLTPDSMAELVLAHSHRRLSTDVVNALTTASGGIPLHAITALDAWAAEATGPDLTVKLQAVVLSRMRGLRTEDAAILARAAVLGRVVNVNTVARICATTPARVIAAATAAQPGVVARTSRHDQIDFGHDLVRDAALSWLTPEDVAATHSVAAAHETDVVRAARHALQASHRSVNEAAHAVNLGRRAASVLAHGGAPEDAAALLQQTITANEVAERPVSRARLLLEHASTVLLAGRLSAAHECYDEATTAAITERDPVAAAEGAAGLGSLWVNTVRSPVTQRWVLQTQRSALATLPTGHESLRLRLRARIAGEEMFWEDAGPEALVNVLDEVREFGDPVTLLEVFSVAHNPLLGPQHTQLRMRLSDEMMAHAGQDPGGILSLMALCWRAVDLFLAGDERAERALADLREAAEAAQSLSVLYVVRVIETMLMICRGQFQQAEQAAEAAFELGTRAQDADALSYLGGHLVAIRWFQHREAEMLDLMQHIATSAQVDLVDRSFEAAIAALAARTGQLDIARRHLRRVIGAGLESVPRFSTWLVTLATIVEAAIAVGDRQTIAEAYDLLEPYGELPVAPSLAVVSFGCVHHWLGIAALATDRPELAERHLRAAVETSIRHGHFPATAVARAQLARLLTAQPAEATLLLSAARNIAANLGMDVLARRCDSDLAQLDHLARVKVVRDEQNSYVVSFSGRQALVRDLTGMRMLAVLTASPGQWIPAAQLAFGQPPPPHAAPPPLLDAAARMALEARLRELASTVARAREQQDLAAQAEAEDEMEAIATHLSATSGIAGRPRTFADEDERARTSVRKAIVRAIQEIDRHHPAAAAHLRDHLTTGAECCYE